MSSGQLSSEEIAEDYKSSLEDLTNISRVEITNLTLIARENVHAAQAIARTIENHINKASPARKLPALYLLDSVAKNVGSTYTLFFQRNLYQTFMDAYVLVEPAIRRKLEEMLATWKIPPPNLSTGNPVFPPETTRKIDNALIKARTAALQRQQKEMKHGHDPMGYKRPGIPTPPPQHYRNTPPPQTNGASYTNGQGYEYGNNGTGGYNRSMVGGQNYYNLNSYSHPVSQLVMNQSAPQPIGIPIQVPQQPASLASVDTLQSDISNLIESSQKRFAEDPLNQEIQKRLKALLDLQTILQTQQLPPAQLAMVREQVSRLAKPTPPPSVIPTPPPPPPAPVIPFSTQDLAALLATASQQVLPPQPAPIVQTPIALPPPQFPPTNNDPAALFASLQKAGLLSGFPGLSGLSGLPMGIPPPPPPSGLPFPFPPPPNMLNVPKGLVMGGKLEWRAIDVELTSMSLKIPRPHLIPLLNETLPNQCSSCARRFADTEQGKREKASHLDWHFRVHQRMADSMKRGQNRSWYVDEEEWIKSRDDGEDITSLAPLNGNPSDPTFSTTKPEPNPKDQYVVVPDPSATHTVCPICQEELHYVWHDETEEFVWMDAKSVGGRIYHASCHSEASKDKATGITGSRGGTPDLKRKADDGESNIRIKIKRET